MSSTAMGVARLIDEQEANRKAIAKYMRVFLIARKVNKKFVSLPSRSTGVFWF
jgi:hypothetical protein